MAFGVVNVGRIALREDSAVTVSNGALGRTVEISGQESMPRVSIAQLRQREEDILGMEGNLLPVTFSQKSELDGFYYIDAANGSYDVWGGIGVMSWSMNLIRAGRSSDLDFETRMSGPVSRTNDFAVVGSKWSAPPVGHTAFTAYSNPPLITTRDTSEGDIKVYRGLPLNNNIKWGSTPPGYMLGRCRIIDADGLERTSNTSPLPATGWEINNGLVRVDNQGATLRISAWTGDAWKPKTYDVTFTPVWEGIYGSGTLQAMGTPDYCTIIRNDFENSIIRLTKNLGIPGRITVDIQLRRGARMAELYVQHEHGTTLKVVRKIAEGSATATGYIRASAADADGNRFVIGSAKNFTADNVNGGISKDNAVALAAFIAVEVASPPAGDAAADLYAQYIGSPIESVQGVAR